MIKIIAPHPNASITPINNVLLILRPWTLKAGVGKLRRKRNMVVHYRANPRSSTYMLERATEFISAHAKDAAVDLYVHADVAGEVVATDHAWIRNVFDENEIASLNDNQYDTIIFLYADAIGLGWDDFEKQMLRFSPAQFIVINGRRRIFFWDAEARRMLHWRRFMALTWWWEWFLAPWFLVVSMVYTLSDLFRHKKITGAR